MPITRTPIIDDDGTGTTGTVIDNAWKTELYNQIDAQVPAYGTWTPTDASGAGLVFSYAAGDWARIGRVVCAWFQVVYPATSNAANAIIGGLPFPVRTMVGVSQGYGTIRIWNALQNTATIQVLNSATGVASPNSAMTGGNFIATAVYLTD